ncbi:hypothetical protein HY479_01155 [Candidatus Uhrbacteria bacterium]|nr:hypothetical protein [Candidatus Uhrbacteria bacterium]
MPNMEGGLAKKLKPAAPSERAEYVAPRELPKRAKPKEVPEAKVVLSEEVEREQKESEQRAEELRERMHPSAEKLRRRSENERELAKNILEEFRETLGTKTRRGERTITDQEMDRYGRELEEIRERLEGLQADARRVPAGEKIGDIMNENFLALEEIEAGIRASKMEPRIAESELRFGAKVSGVELAEEAGGRAGQQEMSQIINRIKQQYGAHPEALMGGNVPGVKGLFSSLSFRFKNALAHLTNQKSEYDLYRDAMSRSKRGEAAAIERVPHERRRRAPKAEAVPETVTSEIATEADEFVIPEEDRKRILKQMEEEEEKSGIIEIPEADRKRILQQMEEEEIDRGWEVTPEMEEKITQAKKKREAAEIPPPAGQDHGGVQKIEREQEPMSIARAQELVPNADRLWELVNANLNKNPVAAGILGMENVKSFPAPESPSTSFIFMIANYKDAMARQNDAEANRWYAKTMEHAKALNLDKNALLLSTLAERVGPKDVLRGTKERRGIVSRQQKRWRGTA